MGSEMPVTLAGPSSSLLLVVAGAIVALVACVNLFLSVMGGDRAALSLLNASLGSQGGKDAAGNF